MASTQLKTLLLCLAAIAGPVGCATSIDDTDPAARTTDGIRQGVDARDYPESVLIDFTLTSGPTIGSTQCSGTLIAPRVVLTAAHCVANARSWFVKAPYAGATSVATAAATAPGFDVTDPATPDIGLLFLTFPIRLGAYPQIASAERADGASVAQIGRVRDGQVSSTQLFVRAPVTLLHGSAQGYPSLYYTTSDIAEHGDSGGPVIAAGSSPHLLVGLNQAVAQDSETLAVLNIIARVDRVNGWISQQVAAHP